MAACHTTRWIVDEEVERDLPAILAAMDQPSVDGVNTWLVSKAAHEAGLKVVLSGVGGDELFGGYSHFDVLPKWKKQQAALRKVPGMAALGRESAAIGGQIWAGSNQGCCVEYATELRTLASTSLKEACLCPGSCPSCWVRSSLWRASPHSSLPGLLQASIGGDI